MPSADHSIAQIERVAHLQTALKHISSWMSANLLTLNSSKIEFLILGLKQQLSKIDNSSLNTTHSACHAWPAPGQRARIKKRQLVVHDLYNRKKTYIVILYINVKKTQEPRLHQRHSTLDPQVKVIAIGPALAGHCRRPNVITVAQNRDTLVLPQIDGRCWRSLLTKSASHHQATGNSPQHSSTQQMLREPKQRSFEPSLSTHWQDASVTTTQEHNWRQYHIQRRK